MDWRVFVIGPLAEPYADHIPKLRDYFIGRLVEDHGYEVVASSQAGASALEKRAGKGPDSIIVSTPGEELLRADISTNVFHQIDNADLIIADLSGNRPVVIYELALAHALGIETILVGSRETTPMSLLQMRYHAINFQSDPLVSATLAVDVDMWTKTRLKIRVAENPFQSFYGAPLLDISPASGLAAGFYENFVRPILLGGEILERRPVVEPHPIWGLLGRTRLGEVETSRPLHGVIVVRPESLITPILELERETGEMLMSKFEGRYTSGKDGRTFIRVGHGPPRTPFFVVGNCLIDIPRTMFSLNLSRRLIRLREAVRDSDAMHLNMQNVLIEGFFDNLKRYIYHDRQIRDSPITLHVGTVEELPEIIAMVGRQAGPQGLPW